jgi:hypothetical protein
MGTTIFYLFSKCGNFFFVLRANVITLSDNYNKLIGIFNSLCVSKPQPMQNVKA